MLNGRRLRGEVSGGHADRRVAGHRADAAPPAVDEQQRRSGRVRPAPRRCGPCCPRGPGRGPPCTGRCPRCPGLRSLACGGQGEGLPELQRATRVGLVVGDDVGQRSHRRALRRPGQVGVEIALELVAQHGGAALDRVARLKPRRRGWHRAPRARPRPRPTGSVRRCPRRHLARDDADARAAQGGLETGRRRSRALQRVGRRRRVCGSTPQSAVSSAAASATVRVIGPAVSWLEAIGTIPVRLTRPTVGLTPTAELAVAGLGSTRRSPCRW